MPFFPTTVGGAPTRHRRSPPPRAPSARRTFPREAAVRYSVANPDSGAAVGDDTATLTFADNAPADVKDLRRQHLPRKHPHLHRREEDLRGQGDHQRRRHRAAPSVRGDCPHHRPRRRWPPRDHRPSGGPRGFPAGRRRCRWTAGGRTRRRCLPTQLGRPPGSGAGEAGQDHRALCGGAQCDHGERTGCSRELRRRERLGSDQGPLRQGHHGGRCRRPREQRCLHHRRAPRLPLLGEGRCRGQSAGGVVLADPRRLRHPELDDGRGLHRRLPAGGVRGPGPRTGEIQDRWARPVPLLDQGAERARGLRQVLHGHLCLPLGQGRWPERETRAAQHRGQSEDPAGQ